MAQAIAELPHSVTGSGPALVLLHGAGGSIQANYGPIISRLSQRFTVIAPDLPGTGRTPVDIAPLDPADLAARVVATAEAAGQETFRICGYSMGAAIAVAAAARNPERVTALVLTAGFIRLDDGSRARTARWRTLLDGPRDELARHVLCMMASENYLARISPAQFAGLAELIALSVPPGAQSHVDLTLAVDLADLLSRITAPTLVIGPTDDRLLAPRLPRDLAAGITGAKFADIAGGHAVSLESADRWATLIIDFLTSH
jgi:pimeloyl-ACP methyl ester carboxylesterase